MSRRPLCLNDELMSCWYHGYSYGLEDGVLRTIVASPDDPIIGKVRIRTYPVQERSGMIFVFVGDEDYQPVPPLSSDLPLRIGTDEDPNAVAYILDDQVFVRGIHRTGNSNWRLAVENGYDPGHWLVHMGNTIIASADVLFPLGAQPVSDEAIRVVEEEDGPKGVMMMYNKPEAWRMVLENPVLGLKARGTKPYYLRTSMYLPGVLLVEHWPIPGWAQYEWYVPTDETHHEYWEVLVAHCRSEAELKDAEYRYNNVFEKLALRDFNDNDLFAREAMQNFYETGDGWNKEVLCQLDNALTAWRKVASRYNRGIQDPPASHQINGGGNGSG
jgi:phenylpropionate dioxygenase-like ring-hydroxylating dioxygenase large terminal subunit